MCVQRCAVSHACGTDGLTVHPVNAVTGGEHSRHGSMRSGTGDQNVPVVIHIHGTLRKTRGRFMANATKMPSAGSVPVSPVTVSRMSTKPAESSAVQPCRQGNAEVKEEAFNADRETFSIGVVFNERRFPVFCAAGAAAVTASAPVCAPAAFFCPRMAVATVFIFTVILGLFSTRSTMILEARNSSRRCNTVTEEPKRVRNSASSSALSPPPPRRWACL